MFRDAQALDRQRTASSFNQAMRRYAAGTERWYTGTVDSVDTRLANCERLLHHASATVARMPISDSGHYLQAAEYLDSDRRSLLALREDLLTGAAGREDVTGPPGWRSASSRLAWPGRPGPMSDDEWYAHSPESDEGPAGHEPPPPPHGTAMDPRMKEVEQPGYDPAAAEAQRTEQAHDYVQRAYPDLAGGGQGMDPEDIENQQYLQRPNPLAEIGHNADVANHQEFLQTKRQNQLEKQQQPAKEEAASATHWRADQSKFTPNASPGQMSLFNETPSEHLPKPVRQDRDRKRARLAGIDRRWVELEAARFVAANTDCLDDSHELAVRAANHAEVKTSTFPRARSAAISEAFVARVGDLGQQSYRPAIKTAAVFQDFDPQALFL